MQPTSLLAALSIAAALLLPAPARAGEGHDHGAAAPAAANTALPRFTAVSGAFELVGVREGRWLTLWLDRAADNAPVTDARIELDVAGEKLTTEQDGDAYEAVLAAEPGPGVLPVAATVTVGGEVALLAGEFDHDAQAHEPHADAAASARPWVRRAAWAAGAAALAILAAALFFLGRRTAATRQRRAGDAA